MVSLRVLGWYRGTVFELRADRQKHALHYIRLRFGRRWRRLFYGLD